MQQFHFPPYHSVTVSTLEPEEARCSGRILEARDSRIALALSATILPGTLVRIEADRFQMLGEVIASDRNDTRRVYVRVEHAVLGKEELSASAGQPSH
jgi:hypothetical protein